MAVSWRFNPGACSCGSVCAARVVEGLSAAFLCEKMDRSYRFMLWGEASGTFFTGSKIRGDKPEEGAEIQRAVCSEFAKKYSARVLFFGGIAGQKVDECRQDLQA
jgi:hypothetical protein